MLSDGDAKADGGEFIPFHRQLTFLRFPAASAFFPALCSSSSAKKEAEYHFPTAQLLKET